MSVYVELPSDADFTAFLASLTPSRVLRDRSANHSKVERQRATYLKQQDKTNRAAAERRARELDDLVARITARAKESTT